LRTPELPTEGTLISEDEAPQPEPLLSDGEPSPSGDIKPPAHRPRTRRRRGRRRWPIVLASVLLALLVIAGAGAGWGYYVARPWAVKLQANVEKDLQGGAAELQLGSDAIHQANKDHNPALLDQAIAHFTKSRVQFQRASSRLQSEWAVRDAEQVPSLGPGYLKPRVAVVTHVAAMGVALNDAGTDTAGVDRVLLAPGNKDLHGGERLIGVLNTAGPGLAKVRADLDRASAAAALVNTALLPTAQRQTFAKTKDQIQSALGGIAEFQRLSPVLLEILGANGARTYLIEQVDPAELRGGGGFVGSYSLLSADHGVLKLGKTGDVGALDYPYPLKGNKKYIAPPNSSLQFTTHGWVFGDSNFSPDFPTSARAGEQLFLNETGTKVDGVISMDPNAVAALLSVTGPIAVPEYNTTAQASTFPEEVFQREEKLVNIVPGKKKFFAVVAERLIEKISSLSSDQWPSLLNLLNGAVQARHLQVYFNNEAAEAEMGRINWAGSTVLTTTSVEAMLEAESNFAGTKANHFLERSYDLTLVNENGKLKHHLVINFKNSTPDGYAGGRHYDGYLRFYYSGSATDAVTQNLVKDRYPSDETPSGAKLADGWVYLDPKGSKQGYVTYQVVIDYTTDLGDPAHAHEIYWQKQAGTLSDKVHISYQAGGKTFTADTDLGQDRLLSLTVQGLEVKPGNVPAAHLPILG
jgi:Protein of unknown function (DUF4012)